MEVCGHHFSAYKSFQRKSGEHVKAKTAIDCQLRAKKVEISLDGWSSYGNQNTIKRRSLRQENLQPCNVYHNVVRWKVIQNITLRLISKGEETTKSHCQTCYHRNTGREVGDFCKTIHGRSLKRAINEQAIVV